MIGGNQPKPLVIDLGTFRQIDAVMLCGISLSTKALVYHRIDEPIRAVADVYNSGRQDP